MRVAFLGLGIMGRPMAANLVKAGHDVVVWNRTPREPVAGAAIAATPREASIGREVVWICVSDTAAVEEVLFGADGVEDALTEGMVVVDSSTIAPSATRDFATRIQILGSDYVDAPITGSKIGAESGQLIFIAGGSEQAIARIQPLFSAMGKAVKHMGDTSMGQASKIAMNLMIALIYEGFAEALTLATRLGVEPERLLDLVQASMVRSGVVDYKAPFVLKRDFAPNFPLRLMHKDIKITLETAKGSGLQLPALETVERIYARAHSKGHDDLDYAATLLHVE